VPRRRGYTLLEIILVCALIAIIAALSYPSVESMYGAYKVQAAADGVKAAWANARLHALEEARAYRFSVIPGKGNFRVAPDSPEFWSGSVDRDPNNPAYILEDALPSKVRFAFQGNGADGPAGDSEEPGKVDPSQYVTVAVFNTDGTADEDCEIAFHYGSGRPMVMRLRAITGLGMVKPNKPEGNGP
jgi:prepilin-type N-terminal cleavage/methylation domain-containing protein